MARFSYDHPRPALTVDAVVFGFDGGSLKILLIRRGIEPFLGTWALPGGFVRMAESLEEAARRELAEESGLDSIWLEQLATYGGIDRDPRGRVVSVAYLALVALVQHRPSAATDAVDAAWFAIDDLPDLAFDHERIIDDGLKRLRAKVRYAPIGFELLPEKFTMPQLQELYETVLGQDLDKRNFRKRFKEMNLLIELDEVEKDAARRAARLFSFDRDAYEAAEQSGFHFKV
jgi:8-oxo-dGTP diphosphatase